MNASYTLNVIVAVASGSHTGLYVLVQVAVTVKVPNSVGRPLMTPVLELYVTPAGNPVTSTDPLLPVTVIDVISVFKHTFCVASGLIVTLGSGFTTTSIVFEPVQLWASLAVRVYVTVVAAVGVWVAAVTAGLVGVVVTGTLPLFAAHVYVYAGLLPVPAVPPVAALAERVTD